MESLQLPEDLYWDGKMEPYSPSSELFSLANGEESWVLEDNFAKDILLNDDNIDENLKFDNESIIDGVELLMEFEYDVKIEQWLDGKPDYQQLLDYPSGMVQPQPTTAQLVKVQNPYDLIMELDKIYDLTELAHLTPPQTPPQDTNVINKENFDFITKQEQHHNQEQNENQQYERAAASSSSAGPSINSEISKSFNIVEDIVPAMSPASTTNGYSSDASASPMSPNIAREMQIVDEILHNRAKDLPDWNDDDSMYSTTSSSSLSHSNDDDWLAGSSSSSSLASGSSGNKVPQGGIMKKRVRPYGRNVQDKKSRKKEQNKNAATRYRQKKKQEMEEILDEERQLTKKNDDLQKSVTDVEREIKYLKKLMREFYKSKGLLK